MIEDYSLQSFFENPDLLERNWNFVRSGSMSERVWRPTDRGPRFTIVLLRFDGEVRDSWQASLLRRDALGIELEAVSDKRLEFENFILEKGYKIRLYFPFGEWFYIQKYSDSRGRTKGWYCNIGTPAQLRESTIIVRDLILDIFADADRNVRILDEGELESRRNQIPASTMIRIDKASKKLLAMIESKKPPFD